MYTPDTLLIDLNYTPDRVYTLDTPLVYTPDGVYTPATSKYTPVGVYTPNTPLKDTHQVGYTFLGTDTSWQHCI